MGRCLSVLLLLVLSVPVRAATAPGGHAVTPAPVASPKQSPPPAKDVEFATYGFIDLLTYYEDSEFLGVDAPIFVMSKGYRAIGVTARATRLGTSIDFPNIREVKLTGTIEADFAGDYADSPFAESRPQVRMRHAVIDLARRLPGKGRTVGLKAGSTWSIFAPLSPAVLGLAWGWGIGNAWQRQPQLQLYLDEETSLGTVGVRLAACRPMTGDSTLRTTNISANIDAGDASSTPMMEAELRLERKAGPFSCFVSLAALTGKEDYTGMTPKRIGNADYRVVGNVVDVKGVALALKLDHRRFAVQGEYYTGENLDLFGAQVLSGVKSIRNDVTRVLAVLDSASVRGGWGQLTVKPAPGLEISGGVGVDDPEDHPSSFYKRNGALYCSASKTWFKRLMLTLCWIRVRTRLTSIDQVMEGHHMSSSLRLSF